VDTQASSIEAHEIFHEKKLMGKKQKNGSTKRIQELDPLTA